MSTKTTEFRPLGKWMQWILYAASGLVFLAGFQLSILTEQTDKYFAWTVKPFLTAAFLGAAYWAAVPVELLAARKRTWTHARVAVPAVWLFTTLTLIATLLHFDRFHFYGADFIPQAAAWFWLAIYVSVPVAMLIALFLQTRLQGTDPPGEHPFPGWLRGMLIIEGAGMLFTGLALFIAPSAAGSVWPWTLTLLTSRALGAWFTAIGVAAFHALWENDFHRIRPMGGGYTVFGALQLIALIRYPADVNWSVPAAWIYLIFLLTILPLGLYGWFGPRGKK